MTREAVMFWRLGDLSSNVMANYKMVQMFKKKNKTKKRYVFNNILYSKMPLWFTEPATALSSNKVIFRSDKEPTL